MPDDAEHWDRRYRGGSSDELTWYAPTPTFSLNLIDRLGIKPDASVVDVGGGDSRFVDHLVARRFSDVTVLDVSHIALDRARQRVGPGARFVQADLLTWAPDRQWDLWHDRAMFHFLTAPEDQAGYRRLLERALAPHGHAIIATFAPDGPTTCSALPVERYSPDVLAAAVGPAFTLRFSDREEHVTPTGAAQPFTWTAFERAPDS